MIINDSTAFTVHKHKNFAGIVFFYFCKAAIPVIRPTADRHHN